MAITVAMRTQVSQMYVSLFGRAPDAEGLGFWVTELNNGKTAAQIAQAMYDTAPARAYYSLALTNQEIVSTFYKNVLGRAPDAEGLAFWTAELNASASKGAFFAKLVDGVVNYKGTDAAGLKSQALFNNKVAVAQYYGEQNGTIAGATNALNGVTDAATSVTAAKASIDAGGQSVALSDKIDNLTGTANNDTFMGSIGADNDTLQSDDMVNGGGGTDTLEVTLANTPFAITPRSNSVEVLRVRSQANGDDEGTNDVQGFSSTITKNLDKLNAGVGVSTIVTAGDNTIDAQNMVGANQFWSTNSRADLVIEDVRNNSHETTLGFQSTDPGDVDYAVFFDPSHITAPGASAAGATLTIRLADVLGLKNGNGLKDLPYSGLTIKVGDKAVTLAIDFAKLTTYASFAAAINTALAAAGQTGITAAVGTEETAVFSTNVSGNAQGSVAGKYSPIVLTNSGPEAISMSAYEPIPGVSKIEGNEVRSATANETSAIPSLEQVNIILDDVGRGSMAGDFLAGSMSTGVSGSKGIAQFNVAVDRHSHITTLQTTNNWLEVVNVTNIGAKGNLKLDDNNLTDKDYGLTDVRVFDASAMTGKVTVSAVLSEKVVAKYMDRVDTGAPGADNSDPVAYRNVVDQEFSYDLGKADDALYLNISQNNLAASGTTNREDFVLAINGNDGNDAITVQIGDGVAAGSEAWYTNSAINANLTINAGEGNDVVKANGAGNWKINTGAGNDTVYSDNSGAQKAVWVFNTAGQSAAAATGVLTAPNQTLFDAVVTAEAAVSAATTSAALTAAQATLTTAKGALDTALALPANAADAAIVNSWTARQLTDLVSDNNDNTITTVGLYKASVNVTYRGITVTQAITGTGANQYFTDDLNINQAIKAAINGNAVLNKLLIAQDGPANTLVVTSLIDGENGSDAAAELALTFTTTATDTEAVTAGYLDAAAITANGATLAANDYAAAYALNGLADIDGADSTNATDSTHNLGAGDDVLVLSTNHTNVVAANNATSSNEKVVYEATAFGNDVIVNFNFGTPTAGIPTPFDGVQVDATPATLEQGEDQFDFRAMGKNVDVITNVTAANTTVAQAVASFNAGSNDSATNKTAVNNVVILVDSINQGLGTVYQVTDAVDAGTNTAVKMGTIDLADSLWANLSTDNFVL